MEPQIQREGEPKPVEFRLVGKKQGFPPRQFPYRGLVGVAHTKSGTTHIALKQFDFAILYFRAYKGEIVHSMVLRLPKQSLNAICALEGSLQQQSFALLVGYSQGEIILYLLQSDSLTPLRKYNVVTESSMLSKFGNFLSGEGLLAYNERVECPAPLVFIKDCRHEILYCFPKTIVLDKKEMSPSSKRSLALRVKNDLFELKKDALRRELTFPCAVMHCSVLESDKEQLLALSCLEMPLFVLDLRSETIQFKLDLEQGVSGVNLLGSSYLGVGLENDTCLLLHLDTKEYSYVTGPNSYITSLVSTPKGIVISSYDGAIYAVPADVPRWALKDGSLAEGVEPRKASLVEHSCLRTGQGLNRLFFEDGLLLGLGTDSTLVFLKLVS